VSGHRESKRRKIQQNEATVVGSGAFYDTWTQFSRTIISCQHFCTLSHLTDILLQEDTAVERISLLAVSSTPIRSSWSAVSSY